MFENFQPLGNRILVKLVAKEQKTASGFYIPDNIEKNNLTGSILSKGEGKYSQTGNLIPMSVNVGDTVYFYKHAGVVVDADHVVLSEDEVLGII